MSNPEKQPTSTPVLKTLEQIVIHRYENAAELGQSAWAARLRESKWPRSEAESYESALGIYAQAACVLGSAHISAAAKYGASRQLLDDQWKRVVNSATSEWEQVLKELIVGEPLSSPAYLG